MPCRCEGRAAKRGACERGAVTAELALTLPAVVLILLFAVTVMGGAITHLRVTDAATAVARAAAVGESPDRLAEVARHLAGPGAQLSVTASDGWAHATITAPVHHPLPGIGALQATASASAPMEPGAGR
ncbi:MAG TPA: TadE family type IV pilus minor pilin [Actinomycetaceae bacterium]|nr:TadE family type IV pilus minor pilin [Actinomycetaceae bacterium]